MAFVLGAAPAVSPLLPHPGGLMVTCGGNECPCPPGRQLLTATLCSALILTSCFPLGRSCLPAILT